MSFEKLDRLKQRLDTCMPLDESVVKNLHEDLVLRWTYHTNAIEGNSLTLKETKVVLEGITIGGKTMREHLEALNHREAIYYIENLVKQDEPLTGWQIKSIHNLVLRSIDDNHAGVYRDSNVIISGAKHTPPDHVHLDALMNEFLRWYTEESPGLNPVERAARVHVDFVGIHPFVDGNGRTARLLMNMELMKDGFPPMVWPVESRLAYYEALDTAHTASDYSRFMDLTIQLVESSFDPYWFVLGIDPK